MAGNREGFSVYTQSSLFSILAHDIIYRTIVDCNQDLMITKRALAKIAKGTECVYNRI